MKILLVGADLSDADGRTNSRIDRRTMTKVTVTFRSFTNAPYTHVQYIFSVCSIRNVRLDKKF